MADPVGIGIDTLPDSGPYGGVEAARLGQAGEEVRPTASDQFDALLEIVQLQAPIGGPDQRGGLLRMWDEWTARIEGERSGTKKLTADAANSLYPNMQVPFSGDVFPEVARMRSETSDRFFALQSWVDSGEPVGWTTHLAAQATQAFDPLNMALTVAGGIAFKPVTFGALFGQNVVENLLADIPTYFQLRKEVEVDAKEIIGGSIAGAGLGAGLFYMLRGAGRSILKGGDDLAGRATKKAVSQHEMGMKTDVSPEMKIRAARLSGATRTGVEGPTPAGGVVEHPAGIPFYAEANMVEGAPRSVVHRNYGGAEAVDDGMMKNNTVKQMREVNIDEDAPYLNIMRTTDVPEIKEFISKAVAKIESKYGPEAAAVLRTEASGKDLLDSIDDAIQLGKLPEGAMDLAGDAARDMGQKGYSYQFAAEDGSVRNGITVLDEKSVAGQEVMSSNPELRPEVNPTEAALEPPDSPVKMRHYTERAAEQLRDAESVQEPTGAAELKAIDSETHARAKEAADFEDDLEMQADMKEIDDVLKQDRVQTSLAKKLANCLAGKIS